MKITYNISDQTTVIGNKPETIEKGETIKMNARRDILPIQEILENSAKDLTPEEIEEKILGGKVYDSKPQRETVACNPLPIRFHRIMWTKTKGFKKVVYLS